VFRARATEQLKLVCLEWDGSLSPSGLRTGRSLKIAIRCCGLRNTPQRVVQPWAILSPSRGSNANSRRC
jgi:hypothetical protein